MTVEALHHPLLEPAHHGFFTRDGGTSTGIYQGLNCGLGSNDHRARVLENRALVAGHLGVSAQNLVTPYQTHSATVATLEAPPVESVMADALVTRTPGLAIGVVTADCQPILLADHGAGVIGAAHAGWKGAVAGIIEATVEEMTAQGARREATCAVIGPCISQRAYEVGVEFMDAFMDEDPSNSRFFAGARGDRVHFDLPGYGLHCLRGAGLSNIAWTGHCTLSDSARFFSYRRTTLAGEADYGRLISAICL